MKLFPFIILALYLGANYYVLLRLWQMLPAGTVFRPLLITLGIILVVSFFAVFIFRNSIPIGIGSVLYGAGTAWMVILLYLFLIILIADLLPFTGLYDRHAILRSNPVTFAVIAGLTTLIMAGANINYHNKRRVEITVDSSLQTGTPLEQPLRIVAVSDLHLGYTIGKKELGRWVRLINAENPDIILIAGDLIDNDVRPLYNKDIAPILNEMKSRYGIYMVPGNHEYISGIDKSLEFLERTAITVLRDSVVNIGGLNIAGRDDLTNPRRMTVDRLMERTDGALPLIIMDHQPVSLDDAVKAGASLQISGHTHRGQVWPFTWITDKMYEDSHGLIMKDNTMIFVSSGLGIWGGKFRIGSVSDYVVIDVI